MTKVIGFLGGPGLGKSTIAAKVFAALKTLGYHSELVLEVSKEWAWQGRSVGPHGQSILYGKQLERESRLYGKVDFIITDSPLVLCPIYQEHYWGHDTVKHSIFKDLQIAKVNRVHHINFLMERTTPFDQRGRFEDEHLSIIIDGKIKKFMDDHRLGYYLVDPSKQGSVEYVVEQSLKINK